MPTSPDDPAQRTRLADQAAELLVAAVDCDSEAAADILGQVAAIDGPGGVHHICYVLAAVVHKLGYPNMPRGDGSLTGDVATLTKIRSGNDDPYALWAARFVVAYINGDADNTDALFYGTLNDPRMHAGGVSALLMMAADLARARYQQGRANTSGND